MATNRKSNTRFRLVPKSTTLVDHEMNLDGSYALRCITHVFGSLKRVKTEEKYGRPIETHQHSFERYHTRPPYCPPPFLEIGVCNLATLSYLIQVTLRSSNLAGTFTGPMRIKAHQNFGEKRAWVYPWTTHILGTPYYPRNG